MENMHLFAYTYAYKKISNQKGTRIDYELMKISM